MHHLWIHFIWLWFEFRWFAVKNLINCYYVSERFSKTKSSTHFNNPPRAGGFFFFYQTSFHPICTYSTETLLEQRREQSGVILFTQFWFMSFWMLLWHIIWAEHVFFLLAANRAWFCWRFLPLAPCSHMLAKDRCKVNNLMQLLGSQFIINQMFFSYFELNFVESQLSLSSLTVNRWDSSSSALPVTRSDSGSGFT